MTLDLDPDARAALAALVAVTVLKLPPGQRRALRLIGAGEVVQLEPGRYDYRHGAGRASKSVAAAVRHALAAPSPRHLPSGGRRLELTTLGRLVYAVATAPEAAASTGRHA